MAAVVCQPTNSSTFSGSLFPTLDTADEDEPGEAHVAGRACPTTRDYRSESTGHRIDLAVVRFDGFRGGPAQKPEAVEPPWDEFPQSFIENLLNAVSHGDLPLSREQVDSFLFPQSTEVAQYFDRVWVSQPDDEGPDVMDVTKYQSLSSAELRWLIRCMFRRTASGAYVGIADIMRREAQTGVPHSA